MPVHATAAGKSIAATLSDEELDRLLRGYRFTTYTPRTISSATRFRAELEKVRKEGYSLTLNEFQDGVFSVGVSLDRGLFARPSALVAVLPAVLAPADGHEALVHDLLAARATLDPFREVRLS